MAPKGGNAKKEGGRAKKAENEVSPSYHLVSLPSIKPTPVEPEGNKDRTNDQEKKAAEANKAKDAKEAEEWKSGCMPIIRG